MVTRRSSESATPAVPVAPVVKRKRRASCLGEQERRERKRAIDREAQRSLREKTKSHIADLERTIEILRNQDRNSATANLLSEIETLRAENEKLRDVIENVRSVVGGTGDLLAIPQAPNGVSTTKATVIVEEAEDIAVGEDDNMLSPTTTNPGQPSPKPPQRRPSVALTRPPPPLPPPPPPQQQQHKHQQLHQTEAKAVPHSPNRSHCSYTTLSNPNPPQHQHQHHPKVPAVATHPKSVDLDGMVMTDLGFAREVAEKSSEAAAAEGNLLFGPNSPTPAAWVPYIAEIWGRCPSPTILHFGQPEGSPTSPSSSSPYSS